MQSAYYHPTAGPNLYTGHMYDLYASVKKSGANLRGDNLSKKAATFSMSNSTKSDKWLLISIYNIFFLARKFDEQF
jgi:hypothetical protein